MIHLIRHANSEWNFHSDINKQNLKDGKINEEQYEQVRKEQLYANYSLIDPPLSEKGVAQCAQAVESKDGLSKIETALPDVEIVFVSPMRRCLETAYRLFKDHPNFDRI